MAVDLINTPMFSDFMGLLDGSGTATASFTLPPVPGMAGLTLYFAFTVMNPYDFVSNAKGIAIVP